MRERERGKNCWAVCPAGVSHTFFPPRFSPTEVEEEEDTFWERRRKESWLSFILWLARAEKEGGTVKCEIFPPKHATHKKRCNTSFGKPNNLPDLEKILADARTSLGRRKRNPPICLSAHLNQFLSPAASE